MSESDVQRFGDPDTEPVEPIVAWCEITTPSDKSVLQGPWSGVTIPVSGSAGLDSGIAFIQRVEVQFGSGAWRPATKADRAWSSWTVASDPITTSGAVSITARVIIAGEEYASHTVVVATELGSKPPGGDPNPPTDTTPPQVAITSPKPSATVLLDNAGSATIPVSGTASDTGSGIKAVELLVDGAVKPVSVNTGGTWTASVSISGGGEHAITTRAVDNRDNQMTAAVAVMATRAVPEPPAVERLMLVEKLRLSTYLGTYGPGRTIKTLSLAPGEVTTMTYKTFRRTTETSTETSSILDSTTTESEADFSDTLTREQANKQAADESLKWHVEGTVGAEWGWGKASVTAGASGATNASREELTKNVVTAVQKHAAKASAKREVEVKTSREMKREEGEETSNESRIENINVSRTLNLVFRQMNQEFITVLHLVDVCVAYVRGDRKAPGSDELVYTYQEATLSQLDSLLRQVVVPERRGAVRRTVLDVLGNVFDYQDERHTMVEERILEDAAGKPIPNGSYLRVPKGKTSTYKDPTTGTQLVVDGVILAVTKNVLRTDGIICDAILGQGEALDAYSAGLQREALVTRTLENAKLRGDLAKDQLALKLVTDGNATAAKIFKDVYPAPEQESLALVAAGTNSPTNGPGK